MSSHDEFMKQTSGLVASMFGAVIFGIAFIVAVVLTIASGLIFGFVVARIVGGILLLGFLGAGVYSLVQILLRATRR